MNYNAFKFNVLMRDGYTCQYPGCNANTCLDAHHMLKHPSLRHFVPNGITVCRSHHAFLENNALERERFNAYVHDMRMKSYGLAPVA